MGADQAEHFGQSLRVEPMFDKEDRIGSALAAQSLKLRNKRVVKLSEQL
ncbi:MAG: hypothetical protein V4712_08410 [Pseudomonadota bacterium]